MPCPIADGMDNMSRLKAAIYFIKRVFIVISGFDTVTVDIDNKFTNRFQLK